MEPINKLLPGGGGIKFHQRPLSSIKHCLDGRSSERSWNLLGTPLPLAAKKVVKRWSILDVVFCAVRPPHGEMYVRPPTPAAGLFTCVGGHDYRRPRWSHPPRPAGA